MSVALAYPLFIGVEERIMRKIFILLCILAAVLSGCGKSASQDNTNIKDDIFENFGIKVEIEEQNENTENGKRLKYDQLCADFIEALETENAEKINDLFCEDIKKSHDLSAEISGMFEFLGGTVVSYSDYTQSTREGDSYRQGKCVNHHVNVKFRQIKLDNGKTFQLSFYANLVNVDKPDRVGIEFIRIIDENNAEYLVGEYLDG